jgi:plasmid stability protein
LEAEARRILKRALTSEATRTGREFTEPIRARFETRGGVDFNLPRRAPRLNREAPPMSRFTQQGLLKPKSCRASQFAHPAKEQRHLTAQLSVRLGNLGLFDLRWIPVRNELEEQTIANRADQISSRPLSYIEFEL